MKKVLELVKPNFVVVVVALCFMGYLVFELYDNIAEIFKGMAEAETTDKMWESMATLFGHLLVGSLIMPIVTGFVAMGIKLLDEKPENGQTMPVTAHEKSMEMLAHNNALAEAAAKLQATKEKLES